jgi:hypothetical protein
VTRFLILQIQDAARQQELQRQLDYEIQITQKGRASRPGFLIPAYETRMKNL